LRTRPLLRLHRATQHVVADRSQAEPEGTQAGRSGVCTKAFDMKTETTSPQRRQTELDRIAEKLHGILRRDTASIIDAGKLLRRGRELLADEHGQWLLWLAENFDMSQRTANNYCKAAAYVASKSKFATVANFTRIAPTVIYRLAEGNYTDQEEAEILAQAKAG